MQTDITTAAQDIAEAMVAIFPGKSLGEVSSLVAIELADTFDAGDFPRNEFDRVADDAARIALSL